MQVLLPWHSIILFSPCSLFTFSIHNDNTKMQILLQKDSVAKQVKGLTPKPTSPSPAPGPHEDGRREATQPSPLLPSTCVQDKHIPARHSVYPNNNKA